MAEALEGLIERLKHELPNTKLKADGYGWALFKADDVEDAILALRLLGEVEKALACIHLNATVNFTADMDPETFAHVTADIARSALDKIRKGVGDK